jgi:nicotinamide phosphoribosyltransferase
MKKELERDAQKEPIQIKSVNLPSRKIHKTPRLLIADAYTISSDLFASDKAKEKSIYYITYRRVLEKINPTLYGKNDNRIVFTGLSRILDYLFYEPITHEEIDETKRFLADKKATMEGYKEMYFPEHLWRRVVDEFNGRPPLKIRALREGSVCYPNEPIAIIENIPDGFGELAAWFESTLLKVWASSEMVTQLAHWFEYCKSIVRVVYGNTIDDTQVKFLAGLMLHNFGCRAGMTPQESEWLAADALLVFSGTDTFSGAYQAWKNSGESTGIASSVSALAHRNIQGYENEADCHNALNESAGNGDIDSHVADCYSFFDTVEGILLPIALKNAEDGNKKVVVGRPDSGDPEEQVLWLCKLAHKHGLSTVEIILKKEWRFGTSLKFIEGDGMTFESMKEINQELIEHGFAPFAWGLYGVGGGLRNEMARDNLSAKYALCAIGKEKTPVCKFSETLEKTTLPGTFKVLRSKEALDSCITIVFPYEDGEDAMVDFFDGSDIWDPFKDGYMDDFNVIKARISEQMETMPLTLSTVDNHNYPASDEVKRVRVQLLNKYAPKKLAQNYS